MTKKKRIILIISILLFDLLLAGFIYWDQTRCYAIQRRCTPYDLTKVENIEDIDFFRWLNEKCAGKCWTAKVKLDIEKWWCRHEYKHYKKKTKDRRYFKADTYNPCPELYTIPELNMFLEK